MAKIFFTSDTHFGHANVIEYGDRPFKKFYYQKINDQQFMVYNKDNPQHQLSFKKEYMAKNFVNDKNIELMNSTLIYNWNKKVSPEDTIIHIGDFAFLSKESAKEIISKLNGHKILIKGNHDRSNKVMKELGFNEVYNQHSLKINNETVLLSHYPYLNKEFKDIAKLKMGKVTKMKSGIFDAEKEKMFQHNIELNKNCPVCSKNHINKPDFFPCYKKIIYQRIKDYEGSKEFFKNYYGKILGVKEPKNHELEVVINILNKLRKRFIGSRFIDEGKVLLHGHVHNLWKVKENMINLSVEMWEYSPVELSEIEETIKREIRVTV